MYLMRTSSVSGIHVINSFKGFNCSNKNKVVSANF